MAETVITKENFESEVKNSEKPVLLDFWAAWCQPCRMIAPVLAQVAEENEGKIKVGKVNVDEQPELAGAFGVRGIPMLVLMKNGKIAKTSVGLVPKADIEEMIK